MFSSAYSCLRAFQPANEKLALPVQVPNHKISTQTHYDDSSCGNHKYRIVRYFGPSGLGVFHVGNWSLGKGSQGRPKWTIRDYSGRLGLINAYWVALAPLAQALMECMIRVV